MANVYQYLRAKEIDLQFTPAEIKKLLDRISVDEEGHWIWQRGHNKDGYPQIWLRGGNRYVHRISFAMFRCSVPGELTVDHTCAIKSCVRITWS